MQRKPFLLILSVFSLLFVGLFIGYALIQADEIQLGRAATAVGSAFTYQGRLNDGGTPATGNYDFQFALYDDVAAGSQVGSIINQTLAVSDGLFTTSLDFGDGVFNGGSRYLDISVKLSGGGGYTSLTPRMALTPAPHALALPGLWTQQNATSPNLIGGYAGNVMGAGVEGGVIAGGGSSSETNQVFDNYSTVGGGSGNVAGLNDANPFSAFNATVSGGQSNSASDRYATVGGGRSNSASESYATVGGGWSNSASDNYATVGGGESNSASKDYATVPGGYHADASHYGEMAYASGRFAETGDAQTSLYVLRRETTNASSHELFLSGSSDRITLDTDRVLTFDILVVGNHRYGSGSSAGYEIKGVIRNIGGTTTMVGTPIKTVLAEDMVNWDVQVTADDSLDALVIRVQGSNETTVRWVASVRTVEVGR